ncbi:kinase-like protein [Dentipellis sp. KUC8613]|nr:kinase-like protein [Dentipellis sp. KUC8613]
MQDISPFFAKGSFLSTSFLGFGILVKAQPDVSLFMKTLNTAIVSSSSTHSGSTGQSDGLPVTPPPQCGPVVPSTSAVRCALPAITTFPISHESPAVHDIHVTDKPLAKATILTHDIHPSPSTVEIRVSESAATAFDENVETPAPQPIELHVLNDGEIRYTILGTIGRGGYGTVFAARAEPYKGTNWDFPTLVAIKVFQKSCMYASHHLYKDVRNELWVMQRTARDGPFVPGVLSSFQDEDHVYFVMRLYREDLHGFISKNQSRLSIEECTHYAAEILLGIEQLHKHGFVHGDIKPANILVTPTGHLAVADFSLTERVPVKLRAQMSSAAIFGVSVGTPGYYAPEMVVDKAKLEQEGYTAQIDMWTFGLVLAQLVMNSSKPLVTCKTTRFDVIHEFYEQWDIIDSLMDVDDPSTLHLLVRLLDKDPSTRITLAEAKQHPFFANIDWEKVAKRDWEPSYSSDNWLSISTSRCMPTPYVDPDVNMNRPMVWSGFNSRCNGIDLWDECHGQCQVMFNPVPPSKQYDSRWLSPLPPTGSKSAQCSDDSNDVQRLEVTEPVSHARPTDEDEVF